MGKKCFLLFFVVTLCLVQTGYTPQLSLAQTAVPSEDSSLKQVGAFFIELNAERLADKLKSEGFEVEVREGKTHDNKTLYRVFAGDQKKPSESTRPSSELRQVGAFFIELNAERLADKLKREGFEAEVRKGNTEDNETIYKVFANKPADPSKDIASAQGIHQETPLEEVAETDEPGGAEEVVERAVTESQGALSSKESEQIAAFKIFRTEADAEAFAQQLREKGFKVEIHETQTKDNGGLYTVFAERPKEVIEVPAVTAVPPEPSGEVKSAQVIQQDTLSEKVPVTDKAEKAEEVAEKAGIETQEALPSGQVATLRNFRTEADAEAFAQQLRDEGYSVTVNKPQTEDAPYTVFAKRAEEGIEASETPLVVAQEPVEVAAVAAVPSEPSIEVPGSVEPVVAEEVVAEKAGTDTQETLPSGQVATLRNFRTEADAEAFAQQLREEGYSVTVNKPQTEDAPYTVFAKRAEDVIEVPEPLAAEQKVVVQEEVSVEETPVVEEVPSGETLEPSEVAVVAAAEELKTAETATVTGGEPVTKEVPLEETLGPVEVAAVVAAEELKTAEAAVPEGEGAVLQKESTMEVRESSQPEEMYYEVPEEAPGEEPSPEVETVETAERDGIKSKDIFGRKGGYIHPFLSITGYYTDNVFNSPVDKKSDFVTALTPGVWLAVPGINQKILSVSSSNTAPGGYRLSRSSENFFRRYQVYLLYAADIEYFSKYNSQNFTGHRIEGLFQYNLRGGLTFEFVDQYLISHDIIGTGIRTSDELDEFHTNLANPRLIYNTGKRWWFMVDYANFYVKYNEQRNAFRQRDDNAVSAYVFFRLQPKTSAFFQYQYIDINYRDDILSNSDEHNFYGGIAWDITAKSKGAIKAGYGTKDFADDTIENAKNFRLELQVNHRFTPKTSIMLNAWRRTDETNISTTDYILAHGIEFGYNQQFTGRLTGNARLSYIHDHYKGDLTYDWVTQERKDSYYIGTVSLFYRFREWVGAGIGYTWTKRDSNFPSFEYTSNMLWFNLSFTGAF